MKRSISVFLIVFVLFSVLISCNSDSPKEPTNEEIGAYTIVQIAMRDLLGNPEYPGYNESASYSDFTSGLINTFKITYNECSLLKTIQGREYSIILNGTTTLTNQNGNIKEVSDIKAAISNINYTIYEESIYRTNTNEANINIIKINGNTCIPDTFEKISILIATGQI